MTERAASAARKPASSSGGFTLRRKCACGTHASGGECAECARKRLQRKPDGILAQPGTPSIVHEVLRSPGQTFDPAVRQPFEHRFGRDFGAVRIHTDDLAARSAQAVGALAYTVGPHVVFAPGQFAPRAERGQELLAHELTHVVQQAVPAGIDSESRDEAEAGHVAGAFAAGRALPVIGGGGRGLRKQDAPKATDSIAEGAHAELMCDLGGLCALHTRHPQTVDIARVTAAYRKYDPLSLAGMTPGLDPCLFAMRTAITNPLLTPAPVGPVPGSGNTGGTSGLHLPDTKLNFHLGSVQAELDLPSSLKATLPVEYHGAQVLKFELSASASGDFSLTITLDATPHVSISLKAGATVGKQSQGSLGLQIAFGGKVCQAEDPLTAKDKLQKAGKSLQDAVTAAQKAPQIDKLKDVVSAIKDVHDAIDDAKAKCKQVPRVTIDLGAHMPFGPFSPGIPPTESDRAAAPYVGGSVTLHF